MLEELTNKWAGGICIKNDSILLIYRINRERDFHQEYYVFPGGKVEGDESIEKTILKEFDEVSVKVSMGELFHTNEDGEDGEYYYICEHIIGEPALTKRSNETEAMEEGEQFYSPVWVPLSDLEALIVYPETVKNKVISELSEQ